MVHFKLIFVSVSNLRKSKMTGSAKDLATSRNTGGGGNLAKSKRSNLALSQPNLASRSRSGSVSSSTGSQFGRYTIRVHFKILWCHLLWQNRTIVILWVSFFYWRALMSSQHLCSLNMICLYFDLRTCLFFQDTFSALLQFLLRLKIPYTVIIHIRKKELTNVSPFSEIGQAEVRLVTFCPTEMA